MEKLENVPYYLGNLSPEALRLQKYRNLSQDISYKKGWFDVQDESSQLVGLICNPQEEDLVMDICAGAGGKTMHIAALQKDSGNLIATDKYPDRLKELIIRAKRLGFRKIKLIPLEKIRKIYKEKADILLIDAPCSGTGVYGRHPDRKWELTENRLKAYIQEQAKILKDNAHLVRKGGYLVYATCSIIPQENNIQIQNFLKNHPEFEMVSIYKDLDDHGVRIKDHKDELDLQLLPHEYQSDGFYIAKLQRKN
jgi:16S rRNA (cytosine967-C5)-methyltransferase